MKRGFLNVKKEILAALIVVLCALLVPLAVYASDISDATFKADIAITNANAATQTKVATVFTMNTQNLIDHHYINEDCTDTAIRDGAGTDVPFMPAVGAGDKWCVWVDSIQGSVQKNVQLFTGGNINMLGKLRYFPGDAGMTVPDSASLEPGNNFSITQAGYVDTAAGEGKNIFYKSGATRAAVDTSVDGKINASILSKTTGTTVTINPNAAGDYANFTGTNYAGMADASDATYCSRNATGAVYTAFNLENPSFLGIEQQIVSVVVWIRLMRSGTTGTCYGGIRLNGVEDIKLATPSGSWTGLSLTPFTRPGGGTWTSSDFDNLQIVVGADGSADSWAGISKAWVVITYDYDTATASVSATSIPPGEHAVTTALDSPFFGLGVDAAEPSAPITLVTDGLVLNEPLWQPECSTSPFTSIDSTAVSTTVSGATWALNQGYTFAVGNFLQVAHNANQLLTNGGAIEAWIRPNSAGEADTGRMVDKSTGGTSSNGYAFMCSTNGRLRFSIGAGPSVLSNNDAIIYGSGNWYQVVASFDATGLTTLYSNSVQVGIPATTASPLNIITTNDLRVGNRATTANSAFDGQIGEVRIYNRPLTQAEVAQNYNATKSKYTTGNIYTISTLASVPDNANPWQFFLGGSMPYVEYAEVEVGGVQRGRWEWENNALFLDQSGNNNNAIATFRDTTSNADVTATLKNYEAVDKAELTGYTSADDPDFIGTAPAHLPGQYGEGDYSKLPGAEAINAVLDAGNIPREIFWFPVLFLTAVAALFGAYWVSKSIMVSVIAAGGLLMFYGILGMIPIWSVILYAVVGTALVIKRESVGI